MSSEFARVLVPTDFSELSYSAFPYAAYEAGTAPITVVNVVSFPPLLIPHDYVPTTAEIDTIKQVAKGEAEDQLAAVVGKYFDKVAVNKVVLEFAGSAADAIVECANRERDLIVIATHGHGLIGRALLGSVAERVLRRASCPVLAVPCRREGGKGAAHLPYKKILVTTDFSSVSRAALPLALQEAKRSGAHVEVGHVIEAPYAPELWSHKVGSQDQAEELQSAYRRSLQKKLEEYSVLPGRVLDSRLIDKTYSVSNSIAEYARQENVDLVVMSTRGATNRSQWFGGVAERVLRQCPCPILIVPPESHAGEL